MWILGYGKPLSSSMSVTEVLLPWTLVWQFAHRGPALCRGVIYVIVRHYLLEHRRHLFIGGSRPAARSRHVPHFLHELTA